MGDSDDDEMEQVNHLVPADVKAQASAVANWGDLSEAVRNVYAAFARSGGDEDVVRLQAELESVQTQREVIREQVESLQAELESLDEREAELQRQIQAAEEEATTYQSLLDELLDALDSGQSVWPEHGGVEDAASVKGCTPDDVIDDLKDERPHLPDNRFTEGAGDTVKFTATEEND